MIGNPGSDIYHTVNYSLMKPKVILFNACTVNGLIARKDGSEDFLSDVHWKVFVRLAERSGCFIVGRNTFDLYKDDEDYSLDRIRAEKIVVSHRGIAPAQGWYRARSVKHALDLVSKWKKKEVVLSGGSLLNTAFVKAGAVDEMVVNIDPTVIGKGMPLIDPVSAQLNLKLLGTKKLGDDIVQLRYKVI